jgi:multiple sugar transport system ATP-binding protein
MRGELKRLQHELGTTTVYVTHDQAEAMTLAHRVAVMRKGSLQQFDTPMNIYNLPTNRFVAEFVGNPGMNFIEGIMDSGVRSFTSGELTLRLSDSQLDMLKNHTRASLGIRPEHIEVLTDTDCEDCLRASVYVTELMGNETFVFLRMGQSKLIARAPADFRAEPETPVHVRFHMSRLYFFDADSGEALR